MKYLPITVFTVCLCLIPLFSSHASSSHTSFTLVSDPVIDKPNQEKTDKEKVLADAQKLGAEFKNLFKDLTELSKNTIEPLADSISEWIINNYEKLTVAQRKRLAEFVDALKKEYANIEKMSLETVKDILNNFKEFLRQLREGENAAPTEPLTAT